MNKTHLFAGLIITAVTLTAAAAWNQEERDWKDKDVQDTLIGVVEPSKQVELSSQIPGKIMELHVQLDTELKKGDAIANLDDQLQKIVVESARLRSESTAAIVAAEAQRDDARLEYQKGLELQKKGVMNENEVNKLKVAVTGAEANVIQATEQQTQDKITYQLEKEKLERYTITAPFDCRVITVSSEVGQTLDDQDPIVKIVALKKLTARFGLHKWLRNELKPGNVYTLVPDPSVSTKPIKAKLTAISSVNDFGSETFRAEFEIDNADEKLPAGFAVKLTWPQNAVAAAE